MMKRLASTLLWAAICLGLLCGTAHADALDRFTGHWEIQNVALGGYTVGAKSAGLDMTAVFESDGLCILNVNGAIGAGYISGFGSDYYLEDGESAIRLSFDTQGRLHVHIPTDDEDIPLDVRMRRATAPEISSRLSAYQGEWTLLSDDAEVYGDVTMRLYADGYGVLFKADDLYALRLGTRAGKPALIDDTGDVMAITEEGDGVISFTISIDDEACTLHMRKD